MRLPLVVLCLSACTAHNDRTELEVHGAFAFAPPTTSEAAAYFTVVNRGGIPDTLLRITSPAAASAMLHGQVPDGGMVHMQPIDTPVILANDSLVLAPGGTHLMLMDLAHLPKPGDTITVTLVFSHAGSVPVTLPVRSYGDAP